MYLKDKVNFDLQELQGQTLVTSDGVILSKPDLVRATSSDLKTKTFFLVMRLLSHVPKKSQEAFFTALMDELEPLIADAYQKNKYEAGLEAPNVAVWQQQYARENSWRNLPTVSGQTGSAPKKRRKKAA
ncbi:MAG: hypothetical protein ABMA14_04915 [Hyphomonadaceae bacterium]